MQLFIENQNIQDNHVIDNKFLTVLLDSSYLVIVIIIDFWN